MVGWALSLGIIGTVTGVLGVASGIYSFILSGYRVKINLMFAIPTKDGHLALDSDWSGDFAEYSELNLDSSSSLQILVIARNSGRSKIDVRALSIPNYWKKANVVNDRKGNILRAPIGGKTLPYTLDFGSSCHWLIPYEDIKRLTTNTIQGEVTRNSIFAEILLADGKRAYSKREGLTPKQIDAINEKWERYKDGRI